MISATRLCLPPFKSDSDKINILNRTNASMVAWIGRISGREICGDDSKKAIELKMEGLESMRNKRPMSLACSFVFHPSVQSKDILRKIRPRILRIREYS